MNQRLSRRATIGPTCVAEGDDRIFAVLNDIVRSLFPIDHAISLESQAHFYGVSRVLRILRRFAQVADFQEKISHFSPLSRKPGFLPMSSRSAALLRSRRSIIGFRIPPLNIPFSSLDFQWEKRD